MGRLPDKLIPLTEEEKQLVVDNIGLVWYTVKKYYKLCYESEDLCQIGYEGLIKAAKSFKPEMGFEFSTYATNKIYFEIKRHFRDDQPINICRKANEMRGKILDLMNNEQNITEDEIRNKLKISVDLYNEAILSGIINSLDETVGSENNLNPYEAIKSPIGNESEVLDKLNTLELMDIIQKVITPLPVKNRSIISEYYINSLHGNKVRQQDLANKYNISQVHVSRLITKGKRMVANYLIDNCPEYACCR